MDRTKVDIGAAFDRMKADERLRQWCIEFLQYAINQGSLWGRDERGYWVRVKGEDVTLEELFDRFI